MTIGEHIPYNNFSYGNIYETIREYAVYYKDKVVEWLASIPALISDLLKSVLSSRAASAIVDSVQKDDGLHRRRVRTGENLPAGQKDVPYYLSEHARKIQYLNGEVKKNGERIVCRHLALQFHNDSIKQKNGLVDPHILFADKDKIYKNISHDCEKNHQALMEEGRHKHDDTYYNRYIILNDNFGKYLSGWFQGMEPEQEKHFFLHSINHAMAFHLHCKRSSFGATKEYSVRFYDPNLTNIAAECTVKSFEYFNNAKYRLKEFLQESLYKDYFSTTETCTIYEHTGSKNKEDATLVVDAPRSDNELSGILCYLLEVIHANVGAEIQKLFQSNVWTKASSTTRAKIIAAKNDDATATGLYLALQNGHVDAIKACGEVLESLLAGEHADTIPEVIKAKREDGTPGLWMALQNGRVDAIKAYGEMLKSLLVGKHADIISEAILEVIKAENKGTPGLNTALENGHVDAIRAYGEMLKSLLVGEHADTVSKAIPEVIKAKRRDGVSGLWMALQNGHADAIRAYGEVLKCLPERKRNEILIKIVSDGHFSIVLREAERRGHYNSVIKALEEIGIRCKLSIIGDWLSVS